MRLFISVIHLFSVIAAMAAEFTGPAEWALVNTNAVKSWQARQAGDQLLALPGVVADQAKREVRLLAEAVGHSSGTTVEFLMVGPRSNRAYEALAVTVADPGDIVRAVEFLGVKRGACVNGALFQFWPFGERLQMYVRRLDRPEAELVLFSTFLNDSQPEAPLLAEGFVFTGGEWCDAEGRAVCLTARSQPGSVVSLYNESSTIFDLTRQVGQSEVYGRLSVAAPLSYGALLEVVVRPVSAQKTVLPLAVSVSAAEGALLLRTVCADPEIERSERLESAVAWMRAQAESGQDLFVTLGFDPELTLRQAQSVARLFNLLDGSGIKLYGRESESLYFRALLPQESWRNREDRIPQPFEIHLTRDADGGLLKRLIFIEEDWSGEGLDPKLTIREYPFAEWSALEALIIKAGGKDNRVAVAFFFVPAEMRLAELMPGIRAVRQRLPLIHVFADPAL